MKKRFVDSFYLTTEKLLIVNFKFQIKKTQFTATSRMYASSGFFAGLLFFFYGEGGVAVLDGPVSTNFYHLNIYLNIYLDIYWNFTLLFLLFIIFLHYQNLGQPLLDR